MYQELYKRLFSFDPVTALSKPEKKILMHRFMHYLFSYSIIHSQKQNHPYIHKGRMIKLRNVTQQIITWLIKLLKNDKNKGSQYYI